MYYYFTSISFLLQFLNKITCIENTTQFDTLPQNNEDVPDKDFNGLSIANLTDPRTNQKGKGKIPILCAIY